MWISEQGGEGLGIKEGKWDKCFNFFFLLCPHGRRSLLSNYISFWDWTTIIDDFLETLMWEKSVPRV